MTSKLVEATVAETEGVPPLLLPSVASTTAEPALPAAVSQPLVAGRVVAAGKFFHLNGARFLLKGVTYGTFGPDADGCQFPPIGRVAADFAQMARYGINTVRVYTEPSRAMLDEAARHGLRVMAGIPWAQHVAFLDDAHLLAGIRRDLIAAVRRMADHPAVMLMALGNEIPAEVVRWLGRERVERFIRELYDEAKAAAPDSTFTYVNFPPTEYLELPFLDVCAFNVYLHDEGSLRKYIARLQHIAGHKPLLLAEAGADSFRHGEDGQATLTSMQLRTSFAEGAAGAIAFAWTDEWWRGGHPIEDWAFGLVDAARRPKAALHAVSQTFADAPFSAEDQRRWPKVSVVICAYNAAATLEECLSSLARLTYPDIEVIIVNDGSTDATPEIARRFPSMRVVDVPNGGLSVARNIGLSLATGDIVAYTDSDVRVEPDWLTYLVQPFLTSDVVASGGPNVPPADDPWLARAVALAPGGPTHVLLDDRTAEHVPGCNMAFRRGALEAVGGFNPIYLRAGDDVDLCWRMQARGWRIGFAPSALVWHHHRPSIKAYWRQQKGYGEGEAWLRPHHPDKFVGRRAVWQGRIYSPLPFVRSLSGTRINAGVWGTAGFPSVYHPGVHPLKTLPHTTAWVGTSFAMMIVGFLSALEISERTGTLLMLVMGLAGLCGMAVSVAKCVGCAVATDDRVLPMVPGRSAKRSRFIVRSVIAWLHFIQPLARQAGWWRGRFSSAEDAASHPAPAPARRRPSPSVDDLVLSIRVLAGRHTEECFWGDSWTTGEAILTRLVDQLSAMRLTRRVDIDDGWQLDRDVSVPVGSWGWLDVRAMIENHGSGRRLLRIGHRFRFTPFGLVMAALLAAAPVGAVAAIATWGPGVHRYLLTLSLAALPVVGARSVWQLTRGMGAVRHAALKAAEKVGLHQVLDLPTELSAS